MKIKRGTNDMPKTKDPEKYIDGNVDGYYKSRIETSQAWDKEQEKLIVRLPKGSRDRINQYVQRKAEEEPENLKYNSFNGKAYRPSVNALIKALLEEELEKDSEAAKEE